MTEFMKIFEDFDRMCESFSCCSDCPFNNGSCDIDDMTTEKEAIIEKWAEEHPAKTKMEKLHADGLTVSILGEKDG